MVAMETITNMATSRALKHFNRSSIKLDNVAKLCRGYLRLPSGPDVSRYLNRLSSVKFNHRIQTDNPISRCSVTHSLPLNSATITLSPHNVRKFFSTAGRSDCWKCGKNKKQDAHFCECGVVQAPDDSINHFQVMGIEETFDVDVKNLTEKYRQLMRKLHPDKFSNKSQTEQDYSAVHSTQVNKAYKTLLRPLSRGLYMLRLKEAELETEKSAGAELLGRIMELNEAVLEAETRRDLEMIDRDNQVTIQELEKEISDCFKNGNTAKAKQLLFTVKYYSNVEDKIKERLSNEFTKDIVR